MSETPTDSGTPTDHAASPVFRLIYRSHNLIPGTERKTALGILFSEARSNNKKKNITGALLIHDDWFVQTLEGDEQAVQALYDHIAKDPRHSNVTLMETGNVPGRVFSRWSMAEVAESPAKPDVFLIAHTDGISPAAGHPTTPEQESVLNIMRAAARGESEVSGSTH